MMSCIVFIAVTASCTWALAPRFFLFCDTVLTRRRLLPMTATSTPAVETRTALGSQHQTAFLTAREFNELARQIRAHQPLRDAIHAVVSDSSSIVWQEFLHMMNSDFTIEETLTRLMRCHPDSLSLQLFAASIVDGSCIPAALDHAAMVLRDAQRTDGEINVATAHASATMRMLTRAPLVLLGIGVIVSSSFRSVFTSLSGLFIIFIALLLNRAGAMWTTLLIARLRRPTPVDELMRVVMVLSVHVRAGHSLPSACQRLRDVNPIGLAIASALDRGVQFEESLESLINHVDAFGNDIAALLISAYRDGQPALDAINLLSHEARQQRELHTQVLIRRLPTQLAAPVVLCALPAFVFMIVVPLIISQLSSLAGAIPSSIS